jgi:hypothetical protein
MIPIQIKNAAFADIERFLFVTVESSDIDNAIEII